MNQKFRTRRIFCMRDVSSIRESDFSFINRFCFIFFLIQLNSRLLSYIFCTFITYAIMSFIYKIPYLVTARLCGCTTARGWDFPSSVTDPCSRLHKKKNTRVDVRVLTRAPVASEFHRFHPNYCHLRRTISHKATATSVGSPNLSRCIVRYFLPDRRF